MHVLVQHAVNMAEPKYEIHLKNEKELKKEEGKDQKTHTPLIVIKKEDNF